MASRSIPFSIRANRISIVFLFELIFLLQVALINAADDNDVELTFDERACGSTQPVYLSDSQGEVYSPGFQEGKNYSNNLRCSYMFSGQPGTGIEISFLSLDLEVSDLCESDQLSFRDSRGEFRKMCGSQIPANNFTTNNTWLTMTFRTDFMINARGFHLAYRYRPISSTDGICGFRRFLCANDKCVPNSAKCNQKDDCGDGSDEANCPKPPRPLERCGEPPIAADLSDDFDRVVGGREAVAGSWPWQVDLQIERIFPGGHVCGGALINNYWIVTAAHCFGSETKFENWRVKVGHHHKFRTDPNQQIRRLERFIIYGVPDAEFRRDGQYLEAHDIALAKMNAPVQFTEFVRPICLPSKNTEFAPGTKCFASGFGDTRGTGNNDVLKQVALEILPMSSCENDFIPTSNLTLVCAGTPATEGLHGVCHGDSGGPLVCQQPTGQWVLAGVVSFLTETNLLNGVCATPNRPSAFTKVAFRQDWITRILSIYG